LDIRHFQHPSILLIRDTRSGSLLFAGRLADPGK
jgi:hypothetical protein